MSRHSESPTAVLAQHGRTFRFASHWLGRKTALRAARLYRFCRWLDDLVDVPDGGSDPSTLRSILGSVRLDVERGSSSQPILRDFLALCRECDLDHRIAEDLIRGLERDLGPVRVESIDDLLVYAYQVAGTVGAWMHGLLGAASVESRPHAIDLGIAMQLSNICRDVHEDARRDRVYLPPEWTDGTLSPEQILGEDPFIAGRVWRARNQAVETSKTFYRSADEGLVDLPFRNRLSIAIAARAYGRIGDEAVRLRSGRSDQRARVGRVGKLCAAASAVRFALATRGKSLAPHRAGLHRPLEAAACSTRIRFHRSVGRAS